MKSGKIRQSEEAAAVRAQWEAEAREAQARIAPSGRSGLSELGATSGLEFLQRIFRGELPGIPMGETMGMVPILAERGRVIFQATPAARFYNPIGSVHGGFLATLLDSAVGCAVHTLLEQGMGYTTLELKVNYLRALGEDTGPVRAEGRVVHTSRQIGVADGSVHDAAGRLYAHATTTCLIFPLPTG